jgi:hypothetical protein
MKAAVPLPEAVVTDTAAVPVPAPGVPTAKAAATVLAAPVNDIDPPDWTSDVALKVAEIVCEPDATPVTPKI